MARPWPKRLAWPRIGKRGRRSYTVGFYDHDKRERTRVFPTVRRARAWMDDYITAERRGRDSLRRFLLDLDAKEANLAERWSLGAVLELYLRVNAHPRNEGGLAPSTYKRYESVIHVHLLGKPVASECGTSLKMLSDHYSFPIEDLRQHAPRPPDIEWRAARTAQMNRDPQEHSLSTSNDHHHPGGRRKSVFVWLAARRGAARRS